MSDLIDRQAAIDALVKESQADGAYGYIDTRSIVNLLNALPSAQHEPQWIVCSKKLPENKQKCLLTILLSGRKYVVIGTYSTDLYSVNQYDFADGKDVSGWYCVDSEYGYIEYTDIVTAWMPLPEPYCVNADREVE